MVWAVLIYIALDFASPSTPGAFVFDAANVVESVTSSADPVVVGGIALPSIPRGLLASSPQNAHTHLPPPASSAHRRHSVVTCLPRAHCAAVSHPEDPD